MNPDFSENQATDDWLEGALRSRPAMTAPATFTASVVERLATSPSPMSSGSTLWIEEAGRLGLAFAVLGAASVVDAGRLAEWLNRALGAPAPLVIAAVALLVAGVWYSASAANPELLD